MDLPEDLTTCVTVLSNRNIMYSTNLKCSTGHNLKSKKNTDKIKFNIFNSVCHSSRISFQCVISIKDHYCVDVFTFFYTKYSKSDFYFTLNSISQLRLATFQVFKKPVAAILDSIDMEHSFRMKVLPKF